MILELAQCRVVLILDKGKYPFLNSNNFIKYIDKRGPGTSYRGHTSSRDIKMPNKLNFRINPTKWSNTLKQFVGNSNLWGWHLKG